MMFKRGYEAVYRGVDLIKGERYYVEYKYTDKDKIKTNTLYGVTLKDHFNGTLLFFDKKRDCFELEEYIVQTDNISYIQNFKDFLEKNVSEIENLEKTESMLEKLGVQVRTSDGLFRSVYTVLLELSEAYDTLELWQKIALEKIFNKPQSSIKKESTITSITVINQSNREEYQLWKHSDNPYAIHKFVDFSDEKDTAYCAYNKDGELLHEFINVPVHVKYGLEGDINDNTISDCRRNNSKQQRV